MFTLPESRAAGKSSVRRQKSADATLSATPDHIAALAAVGAVILPPDIEREALLVGGTILHQIERAPATVAPAWREARRRIGCAAKRSPARPTRSEPRPAKRVRNTPRSARSPRSRRAARPPGASSSGSDDGDGGDGPPPVPPAPEPEQKPEPLRPAEWAHSTDHYEHVRHGGDSWLARD